MIYFCNNCELDELFSVEVTVKICLNWVDYQINRSHCNAGKRIQRSRHMLSVNFLIGTRIDTQEFKHYIQVNILSCNHLTKMMRTKTSLSAAKDSFNSLHSRYFKCVHQVRVDKKPWLLMKICCASETSNVISFWISPVILWKGHQKARHHSSTTSILVILPWQDFKLFRRIFTMAHSFYRKAIHSTDCV